jgi:hypothetical protein
MAMAQKDRSVDWCEKKIENLLKNRGQIVSYLKMSSLVLTGGVRSLGEKHNMDTAIGRLLLSGKIVFDKAPNGIRIYRLVQNMGQRNG